jgi:hypothetical protein
VGCFCVGEKFSGTGEVFVECVDVIHKWSLSKVGTNVVARLLEANCWVKLASGNIMECRS